MADQIPVYDKKEQLEKLQSACIAGEQVFGAFDMKGGGTGFLGVTSYRIVIYDKAFMRKMKAIVSIPYSRIHAIAAEDESGVLTGRGFFGTSKIDQGRVRGFRVRVSRLGQGPHRPQHDPGDDDPLRSLTANPDRRSSMRTEPPDAA